MVIHGLQQKLFIEREKEEWARFTSWFFSFKNLSAVEFGVQTVLNHFVSDVIHLPYCLKDSGCVLSCPNFLIDCRNLIATLLTHLRPFFFHSIPLVHVFDLDLGECQSSYNWALHLNLLFYALRRRILVYRSDDCIPKFVALCSFVFHLHNECFVVLILYLFWKSSNGFKQDINKLNVEWRRQKARQRVCLHFQFSLGSAFIVFVKFTIELVELNPKNISE